METRGLDPRVGSLLELEPRFGGAFFRPRTGLQPRHDSQTIGGSTDRLTIGVALPARPQVRESYEKPFPGVKNFNFAGMS